MNSNELITNKVINIVKEVTQEPNLSIDIKANIKAEGIIDSLDNVEIIMSIEEEFNISISNEEAEKFETIEDIIKCIKVKEGWENLKIIAKPENMFGFSKEELNSIKS